MEEGRRSRRRILVPAVSLLLVVVASAWLIVRETRLKRPPQLTTTMAGNIDMCLSCHKDVKLDPAHDPAVIGCAPCHLGNPLAVTEKAAHKGMVLNPGDLRVVEQTCAVEGCHPKDAHKVKNSLMATNRGILGTLLSGGRVVLLPSPNNPTGTALPLETVAGKTRTMDDAFISDSGTDVTDAFRLYLRPLLGSDMPDAFRLRFNPVPKVLRRG